MEIAKLSNPGSALFLPEPGNTVKLEQIDLDAREYFDEPSQETIAAMEEGDARIRSHNYGKTYASVEELFADLL